MTWLSPNDPEEKSAKPAVMKINGAWSAVCYGHPDGLWSYDAGGWPHQWTAALMAASRHYVVHHRPAPWQARGRPGESAP